MNDEAVCRTAPATPGLSIIPKKYMWFYTVSFTRQVDKGWKKSNYNYREFLLLLLLLSLLATIAIGSDSFLFAQNSNHLRGKHV